MSRIFGVVVLTALGLVVLGFAGSFTQATGEGAEVVSSTSPLEGEDALADDEELDSRSDDPAPGDDSVDVAVGAASRETAERLPAALLEMAPSVETALLVDAHANALYQFENVEGTPRLAREYYVAIGKSGADKRVEGDEKTPIGIYFVESYLPGRTLPAIYGSGAFPLDYPSAWDKRLGRTGSGIWIHGTDKTDTELVPRSSRGCLTLRDRDFVELEDSIDITHTPVVVSRSVQWLDPGEAQRSRGRLKAAVEVWRSDWESLDTDAYLSHYDDAFEADGMNLARWKSHKKRVNASKKRISVTLSDLGLYQHPDSPGLFVASFRQEYDSDNYRSVRNKLQYWKQTDGGWRIVQESSR